LFVDVEAAFVSLEAGHDGDFVEFPRDPGLERWTRDEVSVDDGLESPLKTRVVAVEDLSLGFLDGF
jgi:hypothetical protein